MSTLDSVHSSQRPAGPPLGAQLAVPRRTALSRRATVVVGCVVAALAVAVVVGYGLLAAAPRAVPATAPAGLPDRVLGAPQHTADVRRAPLGAALVMFDNKSTGGDYPDGFQLALVGSGDVYRTYARADISTPALLAPDGRTVLLPDWASGTSQHTRLLDLSTGHERTLASGAPLAWSPDGRYAVLGEFDDDTLAGVTVLDVAGGAIHARAVVGTRWQRPVRAALSPDGTGLAVETDGTVTVYRDGVQRWRRATGARLAGPAAWTPDGRGLVLLDAGGALRMVDPGTGHPVAGQALPTAPAASDDDPVRLVAWQAGSPVVVADQRVLVLGSASRVLVTAPDPAPGDIRGLQVAVTALGLPGVPAGPAHPGPMLARYRTQLGGSALATLGALVLAELMVLRRLRVLGRGLAA